jgi:cephalosporin hydroxylase
MSACVQRKPGDSAVIEARFGGKPADWCTMAGDHAQRAQAMNDLERYFYGNSGRVIDKWRHYFEVYDRHFAKYRGAPVHVVEIGVAGGGSLQMWKHYFGPQARIYGMDINPDCRAAADDQIEILIGSQEDRDFLRSVTRSVPKIDILIDDGGHTMNQQIVTFEELFPHVDSNGVYLCEDLHTSYWDEWAGGYRKPSTFIEYAKNFIDQINAWHSRNPEELGVSDFTRTAHSLHFYDSVLVIEKRPVVKPAAVMTGHW